MPGPGPERRMFSPGELRRIHSAELGGTPRYVLAKAYRTSSKNLGEQLKAWRVANGARDNVSQTEFRKAVEKAGPKDDKVTGVDYLFT